MNLFLGVKELRDNPSVTYGASSPRGEPIHHKREPNNKASPERGGEPPLGGGGVFS